MHNRPLSILFIEDQHLVRKAIKLMIKTQSRLNCVINEAVCLEEGLEMMRNEQYDIILTDIQMIDASFPNSILRIKELRNHGKLILLTSIKDEVIICKSISMGIGGYILKICSPEELCRAIMTVYRGDKYYCNEAAQAIMKEKSRKSISEIDCPGDLSLREYEILMLVGRALSSAEIADVTNLSIRTVEGHRRNIRTKLNLKTNTEMIKFAVQQSFNGQNV